MHTRLAALLTLTAMTVAPAYGLQRPGLHLAVGVGGGLGSWDIVVDGRSENSGTASFATSFEIGFAASPQLAVSYVQRTAWFNSDVTILPGEFGGPLTPQQVGRVLTQGMSGLGVTYFFSPEAPSVFVSGGLGLAWWSQVFEESTNCVKFPLAIPCVDVSGFGATAGVGYEMSRRFAGELVAMWSDPSSGGSRFEVVSSSVVVSALLRFRLF